MDFALWQWLIIAFAAILIFRLGMWFGRSMAEAERIRPISTTSISPEARVRIDEALRRGDMIAAIKLVREDTSCKLVEAKKTVETMLPPKA